ncbi:MAG: hypothetical protein MPW14_00975 [Candidatus Manganitrophus sp.]|nr:hypothetical protein [Candidatus Manganitrophus sp.]WDT72174.1 MAG: hypothetical protein MPW17_04880 [Candidatus Manganitrophus sp.]WDT80414.1 MAG: hypothetical protein MPW14_00975 [Candidatus Manganitrophus sp.]
MNAPITGIRIIPLFTLQEEWKPFILFPLRSTSLQKEIGCA